MHHLGFRFAIVLLSEPVHKRKPPIRVVFLLVPPSAEGRYLNLLTSGIKAQGRLSDVGRITCNLSEND